MVRPQIRREVVEGLGAKAPQVDEVLAFNEPRTTSVHYVAKPQFPLSDEPHVETWREYARDADRFGAWEALARRFVQFSFPVRRGISRDETYLKATLEGACPAVPGPGPPIVPSSPDRIELFVHPSMGGAIPVIRSADRTDFTALVRILAGRNEPIQIPESMGAILVTGLNNWDRITAHRKEWECASTTPRTSDEWSSEFKALVKDHSRYQDTFLILACGPYSGVPASDAGFGSEPWMDFSAKIRLTHECAHYLTLRCRGGLGHNVLEEILADFYALCSVCGRFDSALALRFLGLEAYPLVRPDGRIHNYLGRLSPASRRLIHALTFAAVNNLRSIAEGIPDRIVEPVGLARLLLEIGGASLEEVAHPDFPTYAASRSTGMDP